MRAKRLSLGKGQGSRPRPPSCAPVIVKIDSHHQAYSHHQECCECKIIPYIYNKMYGDVVRVLPLFCIRALTS